MKIKDVITQKIKRYKKITSSQIASICRISRQAAHMYLAELVKEKKLLLVGKTRGSYYIPYSFRKERELASGKLSISLNLKNKNLEEDKVFQHVRRRAPFINKLPKNTFDIINYAFTEILNNAIEYSNSDIINVILEARYNIINFTIKDRGVGIFNHIRQKFNLKDEYEALEELLKGKRTTMPESHSGEGIFFTSKVADVFKILSGHLKLIIDNENEDVFVEEIYPRKGTTVLFEIKKKIRKRLEDIFSHYTEENYTFDKTKVVVKLYEKGVGYVSRSQARRLLYGLEKFTRITLDFKGVKGIGQGFADEIFRVFQKNHTDVKIEAVNCERPVEFMIKRAGGLQ